MTDLPTSTTKRRAHHGDPAAEYAALKRGAAVVDLSDKTILRLSGKDPVGMLDAILTNAVPKENGLGVYAALLDQKGRVQSDLRVLKCGDDVLVVTEPEGAEAAKGILGRYAPFSRVKLEDLSETEPAWTALGLHGPRAKELLGGPNLYEHRSREVTVAGVRVLAVGVATPVPGYDLIGPAGELNSIRESLLEKGATPAGLDACETARIEAGVPRFGADITPYNFPGEAGVFLERAVSFKKGCYPGQETVARMRYRGHPNKTLYRFDLEGPSPESSVEITQNGRTVGTITSIAPLPMDSKTFALGYLSRKADLEAPLQVEDAGITVLEPR